MTLHMKKFDGRRSTVSNSDHRRVVFLLLKLAGDVESNPGPGMQPHLPIL